MWQLSSPDNSSGKGKRDEDSRRAGPISSVVSVKAVVLAPAAGDKERWRCARGLDPHRDLATAAAPVRPAPPAALAAAQARAAGAGAEARAGAGTTEARGKVRPSPVHCSARGHCIGSLRCGFLVELAGVLGVARVEEGGEGFGRGMCGAFYFWFLAKDIRTAAVTGTMELELQMTLRGNLARVVRSAVRALEKHGNPCQHRGGVGPILGAFYAASRALSRHFFRHFLEMSKVLNVIVFVQTMYNNSSSSSPDRDSRDLIQHLWAQCRASIPLVVGSSPPRADEIFK